MRDLCRSTTSSGGLGSHGKRRGRFALLESNEAAFPVSTMVRASAEPGRAALEEAEKVVGGGLSKAGCCAQAGRRWCREKRGLERVRRMHAALRQTDGAPRSAYSSRDGEYHS